MPVTADDMRHKVLTKPQRLRPGDVIGLAAPASAPAKPEMIDACVKAIKRLGYRVHLPRHIGERCGFLAGRDEQRAADLMELFGDESVRAIVCVRGGYGSARAAALLDYEFIAERPKILVGYSDITALHCALREKARFVTFHGPMAAPDFARRPGSRFTLASFLRTVTKPEAAGSILQGYRGARPRALRSGSAEGPLVGGNLSLLCALLGTPWEPSLARSILFLEDVDEAPYRIDRLLTQLLQSGRLDSAAGIAVGVNRGCEDPRPASRNEFRQTAEHVFRERLTPLGIPVVYGLPFGHVSHQATLPVGAWARLDGDAGDLIITEAAVR